MRYILPLIFSGTLFFSCTTSPKTELKATGYIKGVVYGDSIKDENVIDLSSITTALGENDELDIKVKGKVDSVCTDKVCWLTMKLNTGDVMKIMFSDSVVVVPQDIKGKEVIVDGQAYKDTLSVENLLDEAKNTGKSEAEIAKIRTPKVRILYKAKGLVVLK
ncbi:MAG: hypothetical protein JWQ25_249 [Daejeonella sp.]|nr:hypothetical protein [Daejeonella sp.]